MPEETEKFLQIEQSAEQLLETLTQLKQETISYKNSSKELNIVREKLLDLINSIQIIAKDSHEIIKLLKSIGGPEILRILNSILKIVNDNSEINKQYYDRLNLIIFLTAIFSLLSMTGIIILVLR